MRLGLIGLASLALTLTAATPRPSLSPDILLPGQKGLHHTYRLVGLDKFPGYRFLHAPVHLSGWRFIEEGKRFSWYKLRGTRIYAVAKGMEVPKELDASFLAKLPQTAREFHVQSMIAKQSPFTSRETVYELRAVTGEDVEMALVKDEYIAPDGRRASAQGGATAPDSPASAGTGILYAISGISLTVILLLMFMVGRRS